MNLRSKLVRVFAVASSVTLLAGYVVYSHVTPNTPPPDPLGLNEVEASLASSQSASLPAKHAGGDLRIISSKVVNQPVFSVRKVTWSFIPEPDRRDPFFPLPLPYSLPHEERVGTSLPGFEMTGLSVDPLRNPAKP